MFTEWCIYYVHTPHKKVYIFKLNKKLFSQHQKITIAIRFIYAGEIEIMSRWLDWAGLLFSKSRKKLMAGF